MRATPATPSTGFSRSSSGPAPQPLPQRRRCFAVAQQAECTHIREIALASAFRDRNDVIGVPKRFAAALAQFPLLEELAARGEVQLAHVPL